MKELVAQYKYPLICGALGLLLAILILTIGILKTLLLIIFTAIGLYLGFYLQSIGFFEQFRSKNSKK
ncbi:DUF2273 domain-containing protein [Enterococcus dispar]|uniref:Small integral membrane protein n=1 Tax=Enterococcus dispar ATCC 51266 TaxID=1139219 RepID=S1N8V2_9ENTE|nr:DUF2273 domain-containing protein [Enterococcus dispar]EOT43057.1 small integral membrane protein [Enterococcus dispar ATCC 51266]EOW85495.1 small integral membrane protein [Enterococcus dispar ATCC 51266]MCU7358185.1 DUF2273 domain-containing protein [Enterococcus dispar]MDT2705703.1 DUF2273 domain-containing protein [Enterococcus dispar]OJG37704.1 small integral membrane protein [Enterococcus dispar]